MEKKYEKQTVTKKPNCDIQYMKNIQFIVILVRNFEGKSSELT